MADNENIDLLRSYCQFSHYPPALTDAICNYLAGQGPLEQVRQHALPSHYNIFAISPPLLVAWGFGKHDLAGQGTPLDELDRRLLDVCLATNQVWACLQQVYYSSVIRSALEYLLIKGMVPLNLLQGANKILHLAFNSLGVLTPLGEALLTLLPTEPHAFSSAAMFVAPLWPTQEQHMLPWLVRLLLAKEPPALEQAMNIVEELAAKEEPANMMILGQCTSLLLKAAPERFTPLARKVAGPDSPASLQSRLMALQALLELDTARHSDLAVEALRAPFPPYDWWVYQRQLAILDMLYHFDQMKYLPLAGEVALGKGSLLAEYALRLLTQAPVELARPYLQQCVAEGGIASASQALQSLLQQPWEGRQEYALSLLAHHFKRIRRQATDWLAPQGEAVIDGINGIAPFLIHWEAAIRLSAVDALAAIGGERAYALLRERLEFDPSAKVRQAIFAVIGLPAEQRQAPGPVTREALLATAFATLRYVYKPAPRWFIATEVPALLWANNEPVPSGVLLYLLYRQSFVMEPGMLDNEVSQALTLFNRSTTSSLASYLFRGWIGQGASAKEAWCLPLICALGDERLISALGLRVEDWSRDNRRKLAIRIIQSLPLFESQAATQELRSLAKGLRRGIVKTAAKATLAAAGGA
jgi:hypothetical protein